MKKTATILMLSGLISTSAFSQGSFKDKLFQSLGYSVGYSSGPLSKLTYFDPNSNNYNYLTGTYSSGQYVTNYAQAKDFAIIGLMYRLRYNVHEVSDNFALSVSTAPVVEMSFVKGERDFGFNISGMANAEFGAGSTYNSTSNVGGFVGVGFEYIKSSLLSGLSAPSEFYPATINSWVEPVFSTGIRYWNKSNKLREISIKYGFGKVNDLPLTTYSGSETYGTRAMSFKVSWLIFLNY